MCIRDRFWRASGPAGRRIRGDHLVYCLALHAAIHAAAEAGGPPGEIAWLYLFGGPAAPLAVLPLAPDRTAPAGSAAFGLLPAGHQLSQRPGLKMIAAKRRQGDPFEFNPILTGFGNFIRR